MTRSRIRFGAVLLASTLLAAPVAAMAQPPAQVPAPKPDATALRVCADPDNLPFSNDREEGLENKIAEILAADLGVPLQYTWQSQRRGFLRRSLHAGLCDVAIGVPPGLPRVATTHPYYRSAYVFVTRADKPTTPRSLDDPALRTARIGLHVVSMEGANTPAAQALAARGIVANVEGFPVWGDDGNGPAAGRVIDAVADGEIDLAIVWGPFAGYFGRKHQGQLVMTPILSDPCLPDMPFAYDISMGVRAGDTEFKSRLQAALDRRRAAIDGVLRDFATPTVQPDHSVSASAARASGGDTPQPSGGSTCASRPS